MNTERVAITAEGRLCDLSHLSKRNLPQAILALRILVNVFDILYKVS